MERLAGPILLFDISFDAESDIRNDQILGFLNQALLFYKSAKKQVKKGKNSTFTVLNLKFRSEIADRIKLKSFSESKFKAVLDGGNENVLFSRNVL